MNIQVTSGRDGRAARRVSAAGVALVLALLAAPGCRKQPAPTPGLAGATIQSVSGRVWRGGASGVVSVVPGGALGDGEALATGPDGGAVLRLPDGREIVLGPDVRVRFRHNERDGLMVEVERGVIVSRMSQPATADSLDLRILTPFGITRVPRGPGQARLSVGEGGARIEVDLGTISFVDNAGRLVTAGAQQSIEVSLGQVQVLGPRATSPAAAVQGEPLDVMLSAEAGPLLVRLPGEQRFSPRRATPATPGTSYRVASGGRARLLAQGVRARLGPGGEGSLGDATAGPGKQRIELSLARGEARFNVEGGQTRELVLGGGKHPVTVRTAERSSFAVTAGRDGPSVTVLAGTAQIETEAGATPVGPGTRARIADGRVALAAAASSDVILPTARGLRVHADNLDEVTVSWPAELQHATVELATDPELKDVLVAGRVTGGRVTLKAPPRGELYWRVRGQQRGGPRELNGHARFLADRGTSVLDLDNPENEVSETPGQATRVYFQSTPPELTLRYAPQPGAVRYRVRVYAGNTAGQPLLDRMVTGLRCPLDAGLLREGSYTWHASALDAGGREVGGGRLNKLELLYDNSLVSLAIARPKPGDRLEGQEVAVSGVAPLGSRLYVNGRAASLDGKGRFDLRVARASAVVFRLVSKNGSESYWLRRLRGPS